MYFESHAHYDDEAYDSDRHALLELLPQEGVDYVIHAAASLESSRTGIRLSDQYPYIFTSVGIHPGEIGYAKAEDLDELLTISSHPKVVAVGEIGLDYHYDKTPETKSAQQAWFKDQLELSKKINKPVIIHTREAAEDTFSMISRSNKRAGVIHCYSGSLEMAREYIKMGFFIGIGGVITFKNAKKLIEVVKGVSLEHILIETDSPYLSPEPFRGQRNDSQKLKYIVEEIAQIKQITPIEVAKQTKENAIRLFFLKKSIA